MSHGIIIEGATYISSKRAAELSGYTQDYIGQLARAGRIMARRVGGLWYILEESLLGHKDVHDACTPTPPSREELRPLVAPQDASLVTFDGKRYVSASRAAKLTSYHQDYIGQLARAGKVLSRQVGNRWYVDIEGLRVHKAEKDALLASVQAASVGIERDRADASAVRPVSTKADQKQQLYFRYTSESNPLLPPISNEFSTVAVIDESSHESHEGTRIIPIRVIRAPKNDFRGKSALRPRREGSVRTAGKTIFYRSFTALVLGVVILIGFNVRLFGQPEFFAERSVTPTMVANSKSGFFDTLQVSVIGVSQALLSKQLLYQRPTQ